MKFLGKKSDSSILVEELVYGHDSVRNKILREALLKEQFGFCAYTERFIAPTDCAEVEHFDPKQKYHDDYYNYYAVLPWANRIKLKNTYQGSMFFQQENAVDGRIIYEDGEYRPKSNQDEEAKQLIRFLGFNEEELFSQRQGHINRLQEIFQDLCGLNMKVFLEYLKRHRQEISFPTAIEAEFGIDLSDIIHQTPRI